MKVALLAAGVGHRLDPSGQAPPKALLRFAGQSLLQRHLEILRSFGLSDMPPNDQRAHWPNSPPSIATTSSRSSR